MRFQIGQQIPVIAFGIKGKHPFGVLTPLLFDSVQPDVISVKMLTVDEHHKVPNHWETDPEKKDCDGYICRDPEGVIWLNQYPRASYGQLSDNCDREFEYNLNGLDEKLVSELIDEEDKYPLRYEMLSVCLDRIMRGIEQLPADSTKSTELKILLTSIEAKAKEMIPGFKYEYVPRVFKNKDGTSESYPDIKHTIIMFDEPKQPAVERLIA